MGLVNIIKRKFRKEKIINYMYYCKTNVNKVQLYRSAKNREKKKFIS